MAGFRAHLGRHRHRRRAREGLHGHPRHGAKRADTPIVDQELLRLIDEVQREAIHEAERAITWETGLPNVDIRLVHAAVTGGEHRRLRGPRTRSGSRGGTCASGSSMRSRRSSTSARSRAWPGTRPRAPGDRRGAVRGRARARPDQTKAAGALFVDVGGGTTDVALVRSGGIEGTRMFALGGRAFTKSIADRMELPFPRAEALKVD